MFKRRLRLPSPALVISMVALCLVLGGTAVAATVSPGDTKADTKLVKKLAHTLSVKHAKTADSAKTAATATNATNATNATHAASATNATNATNAVNATNATNATTATTALSPGTLPSGKTETGTYAVDFNASAGGQEGSGAISFPFPLASAPSVGGSLSPDFIAAGGAPTANCPGTSPNPQAAAGHLCVYAVFNQNVSFQCITDVATSWICDGASKFGADAYITATAAGRAVSLGTWAVTAP